MMFILVKIKEARSSHSSSNLPSVTNLEENSEEREVDLKPFASEWDLKLFREAQALASEDLENSLKGLPDTKTTRYIEMGKFEMEVGSTKVFLFYFLLVLLTFSFPSFPSLPVG